MQEIESTRDADAAIDGGSGVLFKYGASCPISANARREIESFLSANGEGGAAIYGINVTTHGDVSRHVAERTGVEHESPQVILLRDGKPAWTATHWSITADALRDQLGLASPGE